MITSKKEYREHLACDRMANHIGASLHRKMLVTWKYLKVLRKLEYYLNCRKDLLGKVWTAVLKLRLYRLSVRSGITVPPNVFGKGLYLPHHGLIVVNSDAKFGDNCVLQAGTTFLTGCVAATMCILAQERRSCAMCTWAMM